MWDNKAKHDRSAHTTTSTTMPSLNMGDDASRVLQTSIQKELARLGYIENESDPVMAEYITIMLINSKTPEQITAELTDLIGAEYDSAFTTWLFDEFAKASGDSAPAAEPSSPARDAEPEEPEAPQVIQAHYDDSRSRGPPRQGALFQHAMNGLPAAGQKRTASMRSPSPSGERGPPNKARRTDLPTGPRALRDDRPRSLADRLGPAPPPQAHDQVQARINALTAQGGPPGMGVMGGPGMMNPMANPMNPIAMQEMMAAQMALMTHVAMNMGLVGPGGQFLQPGQQPPGPGFQQQQKGAFPPGGSPQRGRGAAPVGRGRGRGRGGFNGGPSHEHSSAESSSPAPTPVAAPQPVAAAPAPAFTPPERPQSPTICKFGVKCTNPGCRWSHPSPVATAESGVVLSAEACEKGKDCKDKDCIKSHTSPAVANPSTAFVPKPTQAPKPAPSAHASRVPCKFGAACTRAGCTFQHPAPTKACRFGSSCTRADCTFQHPPDRVLPGTFHRGLATNTPIVSVPTPSFHNANAASPHKSMSFKPDPKAKEFVPKSVTPTVEVKEEEKPSVVAAAT